MLDSMIHFDYSTNWFIELVCECESVCVILEHGHSIEIYFMELQTLIVICTYVTFYPIHIRYVRAN